MESPPELDSDQNLPKTTTGSLLTSFWTLVRLYYEYQTWRCASICVETKFRAILSLLSKIQSEISQKSFFIRNNSRLVNLKERWIIFIFKERWTISWLLFSSREGGRQLKRYLSKDIFFVNVNNFSIFVLLLFLLLLPHESREKALP